MRVLDPFRVLDPLRVGGQSLAYAGVAEMLSDPTDLHHLWSCRDVSRNSGLLGATLRRADGVEADFGFTSNGFLDRAAVLAWAGASAVTVARLYGTGAGTANAVQTTTANQPPLDLTANPLRIGALAGRSLVATLPAALGGVWIVGNDECQKTSIPATTFIVHDGATEFMEKAILSGDLT